MDILPRRRTETEVPALIANNNVIADATSFLPIKAALYLNNTQEVGQAQTKAEAEHDLSNKLLLRPAYGVPPVDTQQNNG
jgi:hypothetical protein